MKFKRMKKLTTLLTAALALTCQMAAAQTFEVDGIEYEPIDGTTVRLAMEEKAGTDDKVGELTLHVETAGTLATLIPNDVLPTLERLTLSGNLNGSDILLLRELCGTTVSGEYTDGGTLTYLDLTDANIVEGGDPYYSYADTYYTEDDVVGNSMFSVCHTLKTLKLPASATAIGEEVFYMCNMLEEIVIGDQVESIGELAFDECMSLKSVVLPNSVEELGDMLFYDNEALESVTLPAGLKVIPDNCFYFCTSLQHVTMPEQLEEIGFEAFFNCQKLPSIDLPATLNKIGIWAFNRCYALTAFNVDADNQWFSDIDGVLFDKSQELLIRFPLGKTTPESYEVPATVKEIAEVAFDECTLTAITMGDNVEKLGNSVFGSMENLESVQLSESIKEIPIQCFFSCHSLKSVNLPAGLERIWHDAFMSCKSLEEVVIPEGMTSIDDEAFWGCSGLKHLVLPATMEKLGEISFDFCTALETVECHATVPPTCESNSFGSDDKSAIRLLVPEGSEEDYKNAPVWQEFDIHTLPSAAINGVERSAVNAQRYDLGGRQADGSQSGLYIVRTADGKVKKVVTSR